MSAHTPGPWLNDHNTVRVYVSGNLEIVTVAPEWNALTGVAEVNAARIVACVNYCEGVPTETLERGGMSRSALRAERDALRVALERIEMRASCAPNDKAEIADEEFSRIMMIARAALAQGGEK